MLQIGQNKDALLRGQLIENWGLYQFNQAHFLYDSGCHFGSPNDIRIC
jgi:hypothetical protein